MDTLLSKEMIQWENVGNIINDFANENAGPMSLQEFNSHYWGLKFSSANDPAAKLLNDHLCICKDGFIRIRNLSKSKTWLQENFN